MKLARQKILVGIAGVLMAGCAVGPDYKRPALDTPGSYRFSPSGGTNSLGDLPWWQVFKDPTLQGLIHTALTNNYDLKQAMARVEQARASVVATRSGYFPQLAFSPSLTRQRCQSCSFSAECHQNRCSTLRDGRLPATIRGTLRPRPRRRCNGRSVTRGGSIQPIKVRGTSATKDC